MTDEQQPEERYEDEPNEAGFAGDPTTPEPEPEHDHGDHPFGEVDGESIAVPGGDLTEGLTEALEGLEPEQK
jgi:hypothetical protein